MKKVIVDTNVFLRFILGDIKHQVSKAEALFRRGQLKKVILLVPQIVVFEIEFALNKYYKFPRSEVAERLYVILASDFLTIDEKNIFLGAVELYGKTRLSFVDCFLIEKAKDERAEIFSFDKKLPNK